MQKFTYYLYSFSVFLSFSFGVFGQNTPPVITRTPDSSSAPSEVSNVKSEPVNKSNVDEAALVHLGDVVDVDVVGSSEYDWRGSLTPEGFMDGIAAIEDPIYGLCRAETEIAAEVARGLAKFLRDPVVVVKILDRSGRPYAVINGAVRTPQRFQILRKVRLNEIVILSGGLKDKTSDEIQILRPRNAGCSSAIESTANSAAALAPDPLRERFVSRVSQADTTVLNIRIHDLLKGKPDANPRIFSGDVINVLETDPIYVIGGVVNPRTVSARTTITITRAISSAGGFAKNADRKKIFLYRRSGRTTEVLEFNYYSIETKTLQDVELRGFDILEVGQIGVAPRKLPPAIQVRELGELDAKILPLRTIE